MKGRKLIPEDERSDSLKYYHDKQKKMTPEEREAFRKERRDANRAPSLARHNKKMASMTKEEREEFAARKREINIERYHAKVNAMTEKQREKFYADKSEKARLRSTARKAKKEKIEETETEIEDVQEEIAKLDHEIASLSHQNSEPFILELKFFSRRERKQTVRYAPEVQVKKERKKRKSDDIEPSGKRQKISADDSTQVADENQLDVNHSSTAQDSCATPSYYAESTASSHDTMQSITDDTNDDADYSHMTGFYEETLLDEVDENIYKTNYSFEGDLATLESFFIDEPTAPSSTQSITTSTPTQFYHQDSSGMLMFKNSQPDTTLHETPANKPNSGPK